MEGTQVLVICDACLALYQLLLCQPCRCYVLLPYDRLKPCTLYYSVSTINGFIIIANQSNKYELLDLLMQELIKPFISDLV